MNLYSQSISSVTNDLGFTKSNTGLELSLHMGIDVLQIYGDSKWVINQSKYI